MPKIIPQTDLILDIVSRFPNGASVEEVLIGIDPAALQNLINHSQI